ncbi:MAG: hypothetical protein H6741_34295 [Alphaproteobacteria bacterium]|nr:hypothetical protein [Alphaproteobacteria bacterium]
MLLLLALACAPERQGPNWSDESGYALGSPSDTYVAVATCARPDKADREAASSHVDAVEASLQGVEGLVYYSLSGSILHGEAQTLSVWTDRATMYAWVSSGAHQTAMDSLDFTFDHDVWDVAASELPLDFDEARDRLDQRCGAD